MRIAVQTVTSAVFGIAFFALFLFWPAGTFDYWQAWTFIAVFTVLTFLPSLYLAVKMPDAFARRLKAGPMAESRPLQKLINVAIMVAVAVVLVVSALDRRFGWTAVPTAVVIAGLVLVAAGLAVAQLTIIQNNYAAATVQVETGQTVVSTGMYGVVRHPMYFGALLMMFGTPLALGSYWAVLGVLPALPVLIVRIRDEESLLRQELAGYDDYTRDVRYRLLPRVW